MSKIDTLISLINYQRQHPKANKSQIAEGVGITPQYLSRCLGELNLLKEHLAPSLETDQIHFLLSELDRRDPYQGEIHEQLQGYLNPSPYTGIIRMAHSNEELPLGELSIGEFIRSNNGSSDYLHPAIQFSLDRLCYDSLFWINRNGEIEWRLATAIEPSEDALSWTITLRTDLHWSDGKPISREDVIQTLSNSRLTSLVEEIKAEGRNQIHIRLAEAESVFLQRLMSLPIRPAHSRQPYRVTSGAYRLKRFRREAINFRLSRNPDYYQEKKGGIDWITIKRFKHTAYAIKALLNQKIDLIPLDALQPSYQVSNDLPLQQAPFFGEAYYLLFLNRRRGLLKDKNNCRRLKQAIDYRGINRYLHGGQHADEKAMKAPIHSSLNLKVIYPREVPMAPNVADLVGKSVGSPAITPIFLEEAAPQKMGVEADVLLSRIFFGDHYSLLTRYFHSQGRNTCFDYTNPQVDEILVQLDQTMDVAQKGMIGQKAISLLQEDFAIILLSPYFQYLLSPLSIQFDATLTSYADVLANMKHLVVERY